MVRLGNTLAFVASGSGGGGSAGGGGALQQVQEAARSGTAPEAIQKMLNERYGVTSAPPPAGAGTEPTAAVSPVPPMSAATAAAAAAATAESDALPRRRRGSLFAGLKSGKSAITSSSAAAGTPPSPLPEDGMRLQPRRSYGPVPAPAPDPLMKPLLDLRADIATVSHGRICLAVYATRNLLDKAPDTPIYGGGANKQTAPIILRVWNCQVPSWLAPLLRIS
ncbi:hypothetical protein Vafri_13552, partial [Volvox africanus]